MASWIKKTVSKNEVDELVKKYNVDQIAASIMLRRGIVKGKDILYYMEDDLRFQHSPFCFNNMEDAVDRILDAKEENEKVLIFGDRDVDGISSTTILFDCLSSMGIDVQYRLPGGDDPYGLSIEAVDDFANQYGSLIITVDCGISNNAEIAYAAEKGMDVIVLDHHNPPEELPSPAIIIDAKLEDSGYPFKDISGAAVVFKLVTALRFSRSKWYKEEVTLLNVEPLDDSYKIDCVKTRNLVPLSRLSETIVPGTVSISQTRLPVYLQGQLILVWDGESTGKMLKECFSSADFNMLDIRPEVAKIIPSVGKLSLLRIKDMSKIAKYGDHPSSEIGGFYNIFVSYVQQSLKKEYPASQVQEEKDLQLVALAALADIMPMKNENRIFVKQGLSSINAGRVRPGLVELMSTLGLLGKRVTSTDLSWVVVSNLNAAGRLGHPELAAELFLEKDPQKREQTVRNIIDLNTQRKVLSQEAWDYAAIQAESSVPKYGNKLCVVIDPRINRGVSGILAGRLVAKYDVPAMVVTIVDDVAIGSMRSCRDFSVTNFLDKMGDIFLNHGGHNYAAGFSFKKDRLAEFEERINKLCAGIELSEQKGNECEVDAEIPSSFLTPDIISLEDRFEPFGEENRQLLLMSRNLPVADAILMGKGEKLHLKVILQSEKNKWPALFWNEGERFHRDFEIGDKVDILYHIERNTFNGIETPQLILHDMKLSEN